ncbi:FtsX-like permease family protein [Agromyces sp. S2-1-8]|uniref:FtsX-like permease family protein n=1 Tax=Agromyces sp. S2-1-8 TaxID=2897180 RepID=UPI001E5192B4|nr:FtsX-like permease family protein [Agromyces sp. S2-1-8]MCD5346336.1 hypothetical protein [Agromyces sp. S2-1-8]
MGAARTAFARANARIGVLAGIAAVVLLLSGLGSAVIESLAGSAASGLRDGVAAAAGSSGATRWQIRLASDAEAQSDEAAAVLDRMIVPHGAAWERSVQTMPVAATAGDATFGAVLTADPAVPVRAELVEGDWPADAAKSGDAVPTAVNAAAAEALGLETGSTVALDGGIELEVVGLWQPEDVLDPRWFGEPIVSTGSAAGGSGPFLVDEPATVGVPAAAIVRWTATADPAIAVDEAAALRAVLPDVEPALRDQPDMGASGLSASGGLGGTLTRLLAGIGAVRALAPVPVLLLAITGFATLWRLAALLGAARRSETVLLRARGASATRLARDTALEVLAVGVPAAAIGGAAAALVVGLVRPGDAREPAITWLVAAIAVAAAVVLVAGRAFVDAARPVHRGAGDEVGRAPRTAIAGGVLLVVVVAALSLWQFSLYGSPLVTSASGSVDVDPLAVLAPVLVLFALALVALGLSRPIGTVLERVAAAAPALVPALPMRQLARRSSLFASASLVAMLAIGGLTLAAAFAGAWQSVDAKAAALANGAEVRVALPGRDTVQAPDPLAFADPFGELPGVTVDAPVFRGEVRLGSDPATLVAAPATGLDGAAPGTGLAAASAALAESAAGAGVPLPEGAATLEVEVGVRAPAGTPGEVAVNVWLLSEGGAASPVQAGEVAITDGGGTVEIELPDAAGIRLLGLQAALVDAPGAREVRVSFDGLGLDGEAPSTALAGAFDAVELSATTPTARAALPGDRGRLPVVIGAALAARVNAEVGDPFDFRTIAGGVEVEAVVAGVVPAVPTAGSTSLLADLGALERVAFDAGSGVPQFGERWLAASDPGRTAEQIGRDQSVASVATTRGDVSSAALIGPAVAALWTGAAGALLFALIALVALTSALSTSRFGEVVVLRVLGVAPRVQARARFSELAATVGGAIVVGAVVGAVTAWFTARELARATIADAPSSLHAPFALDWWPWLAGTVGFMLLAALAAGLAARGVRRTASQPGLREEER